jgi:hypothetical protein
VWLSGEPFPGNAEPDIKATVACDDDEAVQTEIFDLVFQKIVQLWLRQAQSQGGGGLSRASALDLLFNGNQQA